MSICINIRPLISRAHVPRHSANEHQNGISYQVIADRTSGAGRGRVPKHSQSQFWIDRKSSSLGQAYRPRSVSSLLMRLRAMTSKEKVKSKRELEEDRQK